MIPELPDPRFLPERCKFIRSLLGVSLEVANTRYYMVYKQKGVVITNLSSLTFFFFGQDDVEGTLDFSTSTQSMNHINLCVTRFSLESQFGSTFGPETIELQQTYIQGVNHCNGYLSSFSIV